MGKPCVKGVMSHARGPSRAGLPSDGLGEPSPAFTYAHTPDLPKRMEAMSDGFVGTTYRFLDVGEAARFLGVSPKSLYAWVSQRQIPYRKAGRRLLFLESELVEWTCPSVKSLEGPKAKRSRRDRCTW